MGVLPANCVIKPAIIMVITAFDSGTSDAIKVGHADNDDAFMASKDVQSIIDYSEEANAAETGRRKAGKKVELIYTTAGTAPTVGLALVILPYFRVSLP